MSTNLTDEEQELVSAYRRMRTVDRIKLSKLADILTDTEQLSLGENVTPIIATAKSVVKLPQ